MEMGEISRVGSDVLVDIVRVESTVTLVGSRNYEERVNCSTTRTVRIKTSHSEEDDQTDLLLTAAEKPNRLQ